MIRANARQTPARVAALRAELKRRGLDGFVVPRADRQQNEYLPASEERLAWLTGFTGSAGAAIVLAERAALFVDGRYTVQAEAQIDAKLFSIEHLVDNPPEQWLEQNLKSGAKLGYDPWLHTTEDVEKLKKACATAGAELVAVDGNPIDALWSDRPAPPSGAVTLRDIKLAGESAADKLKRIQAELTKLRADALVVSDPQNVAWAFNIRGADVAHTPLALAFAVIPREGKPALYVDGGKLDNNVRHALEEIADVARAGRAGARSRPVEGQDRAARSGERGRRAHAAGERRRRQAGARRRPDHADEGGQEPRRDRRHRAPRTRATAWRWCAFSPGSTAKRRKASSPKSTRSRRWKASAATPACSRTFRSRPSPAPGRTARSCITASPAPPTARIGMNELFLVDSGAQYEDGTTDITRTVALGTPSDEMRDRFTRVLKGHIAIATAVFPEGTSGAQLDPLARTALWQAGLDFDHGTGHGVGSYLSVHEGPARISKLGTVALQRGMILSNEPGYYKTGAYGIRIENLVLVIAAPEPAGAEKPLNAFETLTLAPIDRRLIDTRHADRQGARLARQLSRARPRSAEPPARRENPRVAGRGDTAAVTARK